jgi:hypothetical protein
MSGEFEARLKAIDRDMLTPLNQILEQFAALQSFVLDLGVEARELLNRMASS